MLDIFAATKEVGLHLHSDIEPSCLFFSGPDEALKATAGVWRKLFVYFNQVFGQGYIGSLSSFILKAFGGPILSPCF